VIVTDASNCTKSASVSITQPLAISLSISPFTLTCNGDSDAFLIATASGGTGTLSYSWNTTPVQTTFRANGLSAGTYTVIVTDGNSCTKAATSIISAPPPIIISTDSVNATCGNSDGSAIAVASGGKGTLKYSWSSAPVQTTATATGLSPG